jgi:hypothetical protein
MSTLPPSLVAFLLKVSRVDGGAMARALRAMDDEGNEVEDAANVITALSRIAAMPWPFMRRLAAMGDLLAQRGRVTVTFSRDSMCITSRPAA